MIWIVNWCIKGFCTRSFNQNFNYKLLFKAFSGNDSCSDSWNDIYKSKNCSICFKEINDFYDHLYFQCPKLIAYCDTILKKEDIKRLNKDNLLNFKNITDEKEIYYFQDLNMTYNLHIKALNSDISFNEIIRVFQTLNNSILMKNNYFWLKFNLIKVANWENF